MRSDSAPPRRPVDLFRRLAHLAGVLTTSLGRIARSQAAHERARETLLRDEHLLSELDDFLRTCTHSENVLLEVSTRLGRYLSVSRCSFSEVNLASNTATVRADYHKDVISLAGTRSLTSHDLSAIDQARAGHVLVTNDASVDDQIAPQHRSEYLAAGMRARISVPLLTNGEWVATLLVSSHEARTWTAREISLVRSVASRAWVRYEQLAGKEALYEREQDLAVTLNSIGDAIIATDVHGRVTRMNPVAEHLTGWTMEEARSRPLDEVMHLVDEATRERIVSPATRVLREEKPVGHVNHMILISRDGSEHSISDSGAPIRESGGSLRGVVLAFRDISAERIAERERTRANEQFRLAIEAAPTGMLMVDDRGRISLINSQAEALFGYSREELLGQVIEVLVPGRFREAHPAHRAGYARDPQSRRMGAGRDLYGVRKDGTEVPIEIGLNPVQTTEGSFVLCSVVDITERRRATEQLRLAIEAAPTGMIMIDRRGKIVLINEQVETLFGYPRSELIGQMVEVLVPERSRTRHSVFRASFVDSPQFRSMRGARELHGLRKNGTEVPIEVGLNPMQTSDGEYVLASVVDISQRKAADAALRASEERFRALVVASAQIVWSASGPGGVIDDSASWREFTGQTSREWLDRGWLDAVHPEDRGQAGELWLRAIETKTPLETEYRLRHVSGDWRWTAVRAVPLFDAQGNVREWVGMNVDITERKSAEREREDLLRQLHAFNAELEERVQSRTSELTATLAEREILLREVHHRVKNNLQVISSLINMQARQLEDEASQIALEECNTRVEAIALIHEKLYQSRDYARVSFSEYAESLASNIFHAIGVSPTNVTLVVEIENVSLSVNKAIPCGLILNELITNALKHAFPDSQKGTISVELRARGAKDMLLVVSDDGVGMPGDFDPRTSPSLGMLLVTTLAEQLKGRIETTSGNGTRFEVTFPADAETTVIPAGDRRSVIESQV